MFGSLRNQLVAVGQGIDWFFSGHWWWQIRWWYAKRRLAATLERHGDQSIEARNATERCRDMDFAVTYWRSAPAPIRQAVIRAREMGVPVQALQLVVLNKDLVLHDGKVMLRRSLLFRILSVAAAIVVALQWFQLTLITLTLSGPAWLKAVVIAVITLFDAVLYRGWSLWLGRPISVVKRWGHLVDLASQGTKASQVLPLRRDKNV
jgi:hypothetical protein